MKLPVAVPLLAVFATVLHAQQVYVGADAAAPMVVTASLPGSVFSASQPAGPLPIFGGLQSQTPGFESSAGVNWSFWASTQSAFFSLDASVVTSPLVGAVATSGEHDVLVYFSATTPLAAKFVLSATVSAPAGNPTPLVRVDVYDDGITEMTEGFPTGSVPLTLGTVPVAVRVRALAEAQPGAVVNVHVDVRLVPQNDLHIATLVEGCSTDYLTATPSFLGTGVDFGVLSAQVPHVLVLGLNAAPVVLPPIGGLPCLLLPQPDALILFTYLSQSQHLAIPAAARPLQLFAQAAGFANGIELTNGILVTAF